jgi:hypothetical protein
VRAFPFTSSVLYSPAYYFSTLNSILNSHNKNNVNDQCQVILMYSTRELLDAVAGSNNVGVADVLRGKAAIVVNNNNAGSTAAHELGHLLGLKETYAGAWFWFYGDPNPRRSNATGVGNFVEDGNIHLLTLMKTSRIDNPVYDFMGDGGDDNSWVDRVTWDHLYQTKFRMGSQPPNSAAAIAATDPFIGVSGLLDTSGTTTLNPFVTFTQVPNVDESTPGRYALELRDYAGTVLSTFSFDVQFGMPEIGVVTQVPFSFYLPLPQGTARIVVTKDGVEKVGRTFSANPPRVRLLYPTGGEHLSNVVTIKWTASDTDGDKLTYDILYSPDGKEQFVIAVNRTDTTYQWNTRRAVPSSRAFVTVVANDGINEGRDSTGPLVVTGVGHGNLYDGRPSEYTLSQNYPNPFNPITKIQFTIVNRQVAILKVYDVLGREVAMPVNEVKEPGTYTVQFDGSNLASGVYFYRLTAGDFVQTKKLLLLR